MDRISKTAKLTPQQHIDAADDWLEAAQERTNDPQWALVEIELAKVHYTAAAIKTAISMTGKKPAGALPILGLLAKVAG